MAISTLGDIFELMSEPNFMTIHPIVAKLVQSAGLEKLFLSVRCHPIMKSMGRAGLSRPSRELFWLVHLASNFHST